MIKRSETDARRARQRRRRMPRRRSSAQARARPGQHFPALGGRYRTSLRLQPLPQPPEDFEIMVLAPRTRPAQQRRTLEGMEVRRFRYFWPARAQRSPTEASSPTSSATAGSGRRCRSSWPLSCSRLCASSAPRSLDVIHAHWLVPQGLVAALAGLISAAPSSSRLTAATSPACAAGGQRPPALGTSAHDACHGGQRSTSRPTVTALTPVGPINVDVVSMGVDTNASPPAATPPPCAKARYHGQLILFVGRLAEKKGLRYLLDAMPAVLNQVPTQRSSSWAMALCVANSRFTAATSNSANRCAFSAQHPTNCPPSTPPPMFSSAPQSSQRAAIAESFGLVFAEAMACGCPSSRLTSAASATSSSTKRPASLVPQRDANAIALAVCRVLADNNLGRRLRRNARAHVQRSFTQTAIAERYGTILQEAAA